MLYYFIYLSKHSTFVSLDHIILVASTGIIIVTLSIRHPVRNLIWLVCSSTETTNRSWFFEDDTKDGTYFDREVVVSVHGFSVRLCKALEMPQKNYIYKVLLYQIIQFKRWEIFANCCFIAQPNV